MSSSTQSLFKKQAGLNWWWVNSARQPWDTIWNKRSSSHVWTPWLSPNKIHWEPVLFGSFLLSFSSWIGLSTLKHKQALASAAPTQLGESLFLFPAQTRLDLKLAAFKGNWPPTLVTERKTSTVGHGLVPLRRLCREKKRKEKIVVKHKHGRAREQTNTWEIIRKLHHRSAPGEHKWISNPTPASEFNIQLRRLREEKKKSFLFSYWQCCSSGALDNGYLCDRYEVWSQGERGTAVYMSQVKHGACLMLRGNIQERAHKKRELTHVRNTGCKRVFFASQLRPGLIWQQRTLWK